MALNVLCAYVLLFPAVFARPVVQPEDAILENVPSHITLLNRFTFRNNVLVGTHVDHWIVRFCHAWFEPCGQVTKAFHDVGQEMQDATNTGDWALSSRVRFAEVDCSLDKPLCNEQRVDNFPMILHYRRHDVVGVWRGSGEQAKDIKAIRDWSMRQLVREFKENDSGVSLHQIFMGMLTPPDVMYQHLELLLEGLNNSGFDYQSDAAVKIFITIVFLLVVSANLWAMARTDAAKQVSSRPSQPAASMKFSAPFTAAPAAMPALVAAPAPIVHAHVQKAPASSVVSRTVSSGNMVPEDCCNTEPEFIGVFEL